MRIKRMIWILFLALFIIPCVQAVENRTLETSGTYFTGESFDFKDDLYIVNVNSYDEVVLSYGDKFLVIRNGTCTKKSVFYEFCVESIDYDYDKKDKGAIVNVFSSEPDITITRTISDADLVIGEKATITVTLSNAGYRRATNVTYTDSFPPDINMSVPPEYRGLVKVSRDKRMTLANGSVVPMYTLFWQGDMERDESVIFSYEITPTKLVDQPYTANVHYFDGYEWVDEKSDSINLKVEPYVKIRTNIIDPDYKPTAGITNIMGWETKTLIRSGEEVILIVDLVNEYEDNESINASELKIYLPEGLWYVSPVTIRVFGNQSDEKSSYLTGGEQMKKVNDYIYTWSGKVLKGGKTFAMKLKAAKKGEKHVIRVTGDFERRGLPKLYDYSEIRTFEVQREDIIVESNFEDSEGFSSGQEEYFTLYLVNPNTFVNFTDVNVTLSVPWLDKKTHHFNMVKAFNYGDIFSGNIFLPTVTKSEKFTFYANVSYRTEFGEVLNETFERDINVEPLADVQLTHEIGGSTVQDSGSAEIENKEQDVILKIKNKVEKDVESVTVREVFSTELNPDGEISNKIIKLRKDEVSEVYQYKINPPDRSVRNNYTITTYVSYVLGNQTYSYSFDIQVNVKPKKMAIDIEKTVYEADIARGQVAHFSYKIKNTEKEPISDIVLHFPLQYETDLVGARNFTIDRLLPDEEIIINNEEAVRIKVNGSLRIKRTNVTFKDSLGNVFNDTSTLETIDMLEGMLHLPALFVNMSIPSNITQGENFTVNITVDNRGKDAVPVTLEYLGQKTSFKSAPDVNRSFLYNISVNDTGLVELPEAMVVYSVGDFDYYTASNVVETYSKESTEKKKIVLEEIPEEAAPPEKKKFVLNIKYIYLSLFIIVVCLIIVYIIKRPKKEEELEFIER